MTARDPDQEYDLLITAQAILRGEGLGPAIGAAASAAAAAAPSQQPDDIEVLTQDIDAYVSGLLDYDQENPGSGEGAQLDQWMELLTLLRVLQAASDEEYSFVLNLRYYRDYLTTLEVWLANLFA